jgi:hypothetical protein
MALDALAMKIGAHQGADLFCVLQIPTTVRAATVFA